MKRFLSLLLCVLFFASCSKRAEETAYVFSYFDNTYQGAGLLLAYSYDGYHWTALNGGKPVLKPEVGPDRLMRDPSICQGPDGTFHMVWTVGWTGRSIGHASSPDLVHWSEQQEIPVMEAFPSARNSWAPELFCDDGLYYIFWASTVPDAPDVSTEGCISEGGNNHRIYCTTTRDFTTFTPTRIWFNPDFNAIDAAVVRLPSTGELLMTVKNENLDPAEKNIRITRSRSMADGFPTEVSGPMSGIGRGPDCWAEGPSPLVVGDDLLVFFDMYREHKYGASLSHDGGQTWEDATDLISMPEGMSHGTAFPVAKHVVDNLVAAYPGEVEQGK